MKIMVGTANSKSIALIRIFGAVVDIEPMLTATDATDTHD